MSESDKAKRSLDTEDVHESTEPAREKRRLELLTQHVLMLHGGETHDGYNSECGPRRVDGHGRGLGLFCCETCERRRIAEV